MADDDVQGEVTDANGDPVQGATVYAIRTDTDPPEFVGTTTTDPSGFYQIPSEFDGEVHVAAEWQNSGADFAATSRPFISVQQVGLPDINNYLEDDFGDNALTSRTNTNDGVYAHPDANVAGDVFIGRYRPVWNNTSGAVTAQNTRAEFSNGDSTIARINTPSSFNTGSWEWAVEVTSAPGTGGVELGAFSDSLDLLAGNGIAINVTSNGNYNLLEVVSGNPDTFIDAPSISYGSEIVYRLNRDSYGNFEVFTDGTSDGTATNTFTPEAIYSGIQSRADVDVYVNNLVIQ